MPLILLLLQGKIHALSFDRGQPLPTHGFEEGPNELHAADPDSRADSEPVQKSSQTNPPSGMKSRAMKALKKTADDLDKTQVSK